MRKSNIMRALLTGALAMSVFAFVGCSSPESEFKEAFEQSSLAQEFEPSKFYQHAEYDGVYTNETPYHLTNAKYEPEESNGVEGCNIEATFENESFIITSHIIAVKNTDTDYEYGVTSEKPTIIPKKGIDNYAGVDVNNTEGATCTYDPENQTCTLTLDHVHEFDAPLVYGEINGTGTFRWAGQYWEAGTEEAHNDFDSHLVYNASAIEGTYVPDNTEAPVVTISNVHADPETPDDWSFDVAYTLDGVDVKDTGEFDMTAATDDDKYLEFYVKSGNTDPSAYKDKDGDGVYTSFIGTIADENGKTVIKDACIENEKTVRPGIGAPKSAYDSLRVGVTNVNYTKQ